MKTEQLIHLLAKGAGPAPRGIVTTRIGIALAGGAAASSLACLLTLGASPALATMGLGLAIKLAYVLGVLGASAWWLDRVARPAAAWHCAAGGVLLTLAVMATWAGVVVGTSLDYERPLLFFGQSWAQCPWRVAALSLPAWLLSLWALRGLAPTRPRLAGFAAGLFSGSVGALGYALFCPEVSPVFVSIWYSLGMVAPAAVGALLGPRLLRW